MARTRNIWRKVLPVLMISGVHLYLIKWVLDEYGFRSLHLIAFITMTLATVFAAERNWLDTEGWLFLFNVLFNLYPVMLQRYNRARIQRILARAGGRS